MEIVKDKHPYCPQCGRKRGVTLRKNKYIVQKCLGLDTFDFETKVDYYICCKNCYMRIKVINFGIWDE